MNHIVLPSELGRMRPKLDFLIEDYVPATGVGLLYGETNVGKTAVAMDMAVRIAAGSPGFHGLATNPTRVLYCMAEGTAGLAQRMIAICTNLDIEIDSLDRYIGFRTVPTDFSMSGVKEAVLSELAEKELAAPGFIVIDTYSANSTTGFSENDTAHAKEMGDGFRRLSRELGAMILIVHHAGWNKDRIRGSSDLLGTVDVSLKLRRHGESRRLLTVEKARDFGVPEPLSLVLRAKHGGIVVERGNGNDLELTPSQRSDLLCLKELGGRVASAEWQKATGRAKSQFHALKAALLSLKLVAKSGTGYEPTPLGLEALNIAYSGQSGQVIRFNSARRSGSIRPAHPVHFGQALAVMR